MGPGAVKRNRRAATLGRLGRAEMTTMAPDTGTDRGAAPGLIR